jgi:hypothetical protein
MTRAFTAMFLLGSLAISVRGNWITSWGDGVENTDYIIWQNAATIEILRGDGNDYAFYAETYEGSGVEGVINNITVAVGATGDFTLTIANSDPAKPGASHWQAANLRRDGDGYTWSLAGAELSGNLAADASGTPGDIICEEITDDITAVTLAGDISAHTLQNLTITGNGPRERGAVGEDDVVLGGQHDQLGVDALHALGHLGDRPSGQALRDQQQHDPQPDRQRAERRADLAVHQIGPGQCQHPQVPCRNGKLRTPVRGVNR